MTNQTPNFRLEDLGMQPISDAEITKAHTLNRNSSLIDERTFLAYEEGDCPDDCAGVYCIPNGYQGKKMTNQTLDFRLENLEPVQIANPVIPGQLRVALNKSLCYDQNSCPGTFDCPYDGQVG